MNATLVLMRTLKMDFPEEITLVRTGRMVG